MGGKKWQRKSSTSAFLSMFNSMVTKTSNRIMRTSFAGYDTKEDMCGGWDEAVNVRTVRPSDDDKGRWVAEPDIDRKASAFIAKFYESRVSDAERQTVTPV